MNNYVNTRKIATLSFLIASVMCFAACDWFGCCKNSCDKKAGVCNGDSCQIPQDAPVEKLEEAREEAEEAAIAEGVEEELETKINEEK